MDSGQVAAATARSFLRISQVDALGFYGAKDERSRAYTVHVFQIRGRKSWKIYPRYTHFQELVSKLQGRALPAEMARAVFSLDWPFCLMGLAARDAWAGGAERREQLFCEHAASVLENFTRIGKILAGGGNSQAGLSKQLRGEFELKGDVITDLRQLEHVLSERDDYANVGGADAFERVRRLVELRATESRALDPKYAGAAERATAGDAKAAKAYGSKQAQCWSHPESLAEFMRSATITGALAYVDNGGAEGAGAAQIDEDRSGLLSLLKHEDYDDTLKQLRVMWARREQVIVQGLVHSIVHASDLGVAIGHAVPRLPRYFADLAATNDEAVFEHASDSTWPIPQKVVENLLNGKWTEINFHDDVMLVMLKWRGERELPAKLGNDAAARLKL